MLMKIFCKSFNIDDEHYKKKYKSLHKKKVLLIIPEILLGSGSAITTSTLPTINPSVGIKLSISSALLTSIVFLITDKYISNLKLGYTKLRDWIKVISLFYGETFKTSMIDKKIDVKEAQEIKKIYNYYLDTRSEFLKIFTIPSRRCIW